MGSLRIRLEDDKGLFWSTAADAIHPLRLRMPNNTWAVIGGGGGRPLKVRMPNNTWQVVSTEGIGNLISGHVRHSDGTPAVGKLVITTGAFAETDSDGFYALGGLGYGSHEVRAYASDFQYNTAVVTLAEDNKHITLDFMLPVGYNTFTMNFGGNSGWFTQVGDDNGMPVESGAPVAALSAFADHRTEFFANGNQRYSGVTWLPLPIPLMRAYANLQVQALDRPVLDRIEVQFQISSSSWIWDGSNFVSRYPVNGTIRYLGTTSNIVHDQVQWYPSPSYTQIDDMPVNRNMAFVRDASGSVVWTGPLNDPSTGTRDETSRYTATQVLPADFFAPAALFHCYVDDVPSPTEGPRELIATMQIDTTVNFVYRYG